MCIQATGVDDDWSRESNCPETTRTEGHAFRRLYLKLMYKQVTKVAYIIIDRHLYMLTIDFRFVIIFKKKKKLEF